MPTRQQVEQELLSLFPHLKDKPELKDFGKIGEFLSDEAAVMSCLKKLDQAMLKELRDRVDNNAISDEAHVEGAQAYFGNWKQRQDVRMEAAQSKNGPVVEPRKPSEQRYSQLLTTVLCKQEAAHGLNPGGDKVYVAGIASPKVFNGLLGRYIFFKDVGANPTHGEYSHRIQWYCITKQFAWMCFPKLLDCIATSPVARWRNQEGKGDVNVGIWDLLFDRRTAMQAKSWDGRSPTEINDLITYLKKTEFPLLSSFCQSRKAKRQAQNDAFLKRYRDDKKSWFQDGWVKRAELVLDKNSEDPGLQYVALKLYGKSFWDLNKLLQWEILGHFHAKDVVLQSA